MFRWYQSASKCYVFLSDVQVPAEVIDPQDFPITWVEPFRRSRWFKRGWTLQELLAPPSIEFFSKEGKRLGSRISLEQDIHEVTQIPVKALRSRSLSEFSVDERMNWAANRTTTLDEDKVYCLLGIFGIYLPLIYGEGEAYASLRLRDEIQERQERRGLENLQDLTVPSSLPFPRNELFTGREDELQSLDKFLLPRNTHQRKTIYGLGGCGKSALALEFTYRALARHARQLAFWVPAISQESFELAYREIAIHLRLPGITDNNTDIKGLVKKALSSDNAGQWLMVVDNADDPGVLLGSTDGDSRVTRLLDYLPHSNSGKILFTTRSRKVAGDLTQSSILELHDMSKAEAEKLLARRISKPTLLDDGQAVDILLESLTYLPLAIVQAAAFINNNDVSVSDYISLLRKAGTETELLGERFEDPGRYREMESTIMKTWHISFDQIRSQDPLAAEYVSFIACIDRINIPQSLLPPSGSQVQQAKAIGTLKGYAFIAERQQASQELESEKLFDMHRLVHLASKWWLKGHDEQTAWTAKVAARLIELIPFGGHERMEVWTMYLSHAFHVAGPESILEEILRAGLLDRVGRCRSSLGQFSAAESMFRQTFSLKEKLLGEDHYLTLTSLSDVAMALIGQGKNEEAESIYRQILARTVLGADHPHTLKNTSHLALALEYQGKYEEAESINRRVLARREKVLGAEHSDTLTSINNLAMVLKHQGKHKEAELMYKQMIPQKERVLGLEHPSTLMSVSNLAMVLRSQGKYSSR